MQTLQTEFAELTPKQIKALPLLAIGCSASEVSGKVNVSQVQISEWKRNPKFMTALDIVRRNALRDAESALTGLAMKAVQTLHELLNNASSEQTKLRAAIYIIDRLSFAATMELMETGASRTVNMGLLLDALGAQPGAS